MCFPMSNRCFMMFTALKIQCSGSTADLLHTLGGYVLMCLGSLYVKVGWAIHCLYSNWLYMYKFLVEMQEFFDITQTYHERLSLPEECSIFARECKFFSGLCKNFGGKFNVPWGRATLFKHNAEVLQDIATFLWGMQYAKVFWANAKFIVVMQKFS